MFAFRVLKALAAVLILVLMALSVRVFTQEQQQPINSGANPYTKIRDWAKATQKPERELEGANKPQKEVASKSLGAEEACTTARATIIGYTTHRIENARGKRWIKHA